MLPLEPHQLKSSLPLVIAPAVRKSCYWFKRQAALTNLAVLLGLAGGLLVNQTIAPPAVHAYTGTMNVTIDVQPSETYDTLVHRAEAIARAATQRNFDRDILVTDVSIVIIAQGTSATVPVLSLTTTRSQWRSQPDPRRWATYYSTSKALLGLNKPPSTTTGQPTVTTAAPSQSQSRSTTPTAPISPNNRTTPSNNDDDDDTPGTQTQAPPASGIVPKRIPTPGNIGK